MCVCVHVLVCVRVHTCSTFNRRLVAGFYCEVAALASWSLTVDVRLVNL